MRVSEGGVEVEVPEQAEDGIGDDVFFNPVQELNRDLTVAVLRAARDRLKRTDSYLDATAASGIRGVRAAADGWDATLCDVDPDAVDLCRENLSRNDLDGTVHHQDANVRMHQERFDVVDLDPFGTPTPFVDAAVRSARQLLCVTATDTAPLCGAHFDSGVRHYGTVPRNTEYHPEMGVRVLLGSLIRAGCRHDVGLEPVLTHATDHYVRTYLRVAGGASVAGDILEETGFLYHCQHCLWRTHEFALTADPPDACPNCDRHLQTAGPIWLGAVVDREFLPAVEAGLGEEMGAAEDARELLGTLERELDTPTHYDQHRLTKRWGTSAMAMDEFVEALRAAGHEASRTHYGGTTFKTDADVAEIREAVVE
jgi:tRNA (guanine26-N2/guanine27-N2)-dimethyltransferase